MRIVEETLSLEELKQMASATFGDMVKAVVDVAQGILALDAELHADLESLLLEKGSKQKDLWGINLYPDAEADAFIQYDSMINIRPSQGNKSRSVDSAEIREKILKIVLGKIRR
jgi:hypothetical protein